MSVTIQSRDSVSFLAHPLRLDKLYVYKEATRINVQLGSNIIESDRLCRLRVKEFDLTIFNNVCLFSKLL